MGIVLGGKAGGVCEGDPPLHAQLGEYLARYILEVTEKCVTHNENDDNDNDEDNDISTIVT